MKLNKEDGILLNTHFRVVKSSWHLLPNDNAELGFREKYLSKAFSLKDIIFLLEKKKEEEFLQELNEKEVKENEA